MLLSVDTSLTGTIKRYLLSQYAASNFRCIRDHLCNHVKCVILVTHQLQYINECDNVMILKEVL